MHGALTVDGRWALPWPVQGGCQTVPGHLRWPVGPAAGCQTVPWVRAGSSPAACTPTWIHVRVYHHHPQTKNTHN